MDEILVQRVLRVLEEFDQFGGASPELVAWELFADLVEVRGAWARAVGEGWVTRARRDEHGEQMWRITPAGLWAIGDRRSPVDP